MYYKFRSEDHRLEFVKAHSNNKIIARIIGNQVLSALDQTNAMGHNVSHVVEWKVPNAPVSRLAISAREIENFFDQCTADGETLYPEGPVIVAPVEADAELPGDFRVKVKKTLFINDCEVTEENYEQVIAFIKKSFEV